MSASEPIDMRALRTPVRQPSAHVAAAATERLADLELPPSGARLRELAIWIAATQNQIPPRQLVNVRLVIFGGDHGVEYEASASSPTSTGSTVRAALAGKLDINAAAAAHGVTVRVLDLSVDDDFSDLADESRAALQMYKIHRRSDDIRVKDALSAREFHSALAAGAAITHEEIARGAQLLISDGIGSTDTPAAALIAAALKVPASEVVRRESSDDGNALKRRTDLIDTALSRVGKRADDALSALAALGGADLTACTAYLLTAARCGVPVLIDGLTSAACALTAEWIAPGAAGWFTAGLRPTEPAQVRAFEKLGSTPLVDLHARPGKRYAPTTAVPLLRSAVAMLTQTATFGDLMP